MKTILLLLGIFATSLFNAQITVTESFEGASFTALTSQGWSSKYLNTSGVYVANSSPSFGGNANSIIPCSGAKMGLYTMSSLRRAWVLQYDSPVLSNGKDISYSLNYAANGVGAAGNVAATFILEYSTDGTTWIPLNTAILNQANGTPIPCANFSGTIIGANVPTGSAFSLRMTTDNPTLANYYMGLDDIVISQKPTIAPSCSTVLIPANNATAQKTKISVVWNASIGATNYKVNIGKTPGGTDYANQLSVGNNAFFYNTVEYLYNTTYYVTVFAENEFGMTTGCTESSFTTQNIPVPNYFEPANTRFAIPVDQTFSWSTTPIANPPLTGVEGATGYRFSLGTTVNANEVINDLDVGNVLSYKPSANLSAGTQYYYKITAYSGNTSNTTNAIAFSTLCDAVTNVPYTEDFNNTSGILPPICSYVENIPGFSGVNWSSNAGNPAYGITTRALRVITSNATGVNAWFYTQGINLVAGKTYVLTFDYSGGTAGKTEKLTVMYGNDYAVASMTNPIVDFPTIAGGQTAPGNSSTEITPTVSGVYYIGFNAHSNPSQSMLYVDNISLVDKATLAVQTNTKEKLSVSPNPFESTIHLSDIKNIKNIVVTDFTGRKVLTINKIDADINLSSLTKGIYMMNISFNDGSAQTVKSIKK